MPDVGGFFPHTKYSLHAVRADRQLHVPRIKHLLKSAPNSDVFLPQAPVAYFLFKVVISLMFRALSTI